MGCREIEKAQKVKIKMLVIIIIIIQLKATHCGDFRQNYYTHSLHTFTVTLLYPRILHLPFWQPSHASDCHYWPIKALATSATSGEPRLITALLHLPPPKRLPPTPRISQITCCCWHEHDSILFYSILFYSILFYQTKPKSCCQTKSIWLIFLCSTKQINKEKKKLNSYMSTSVI